MKLSEPTGRTTRPVVKRTTGLCPSAEEVKALAEQYPFLREPTTRQYLEVALDRLLYTLRLLSALPLEGPAQALEIGARPYFMTVLLHKCLGYQVTALDEVQAETSGADLLQKLAIDLLQKLAIPHAAANIEKDPLPFPSESFDLVLLCEVIEHLTHDPTWALVEIHRVLKKDGYLLVSTPNALRWEYLRRMLMGRNYYPPYSGFGTTARHNREFSVSELRDLLEGCGFRVKLIETVRDAAYDHPGWWDKAATLLNRLGCWRQRLDVIHAVAQRGREAKLCYPEYLYYDIRGYRRILEPFVKMGLNDNLQIDHSGFYPAEHWPPTVRWTKQKAIVFLRGSGQSCIGVRIFAGQRGGESKGSIFVAGKPVGTFVCESGEWFEGRFPLPGPARGEVEVSIETEQTWVLHHVLGNSDRRELGVAVEWLTLS